MLLKEALQQINEEVGLVHISTGYELISYLQNLTSAAYPSLILLDMNLPLLNGKETFDLLQTDTNYKKVPTFFLTTSFKTKDSKFLNETGTKLLQKPDSFADWITIAGQLANQCCTGN